MRRRTSCVLAIALACSVVMVLPRDGAFGFVAPGVSSSLGTSLSSPSSVKMFSPARLEPKRTSPLALATLAAAGVAAAVMLRRAAVMPTVSVGGKTARRFFNFGGESSEPASQDGIYQFTVKDIDGQEVPLSKYDGKVVLIVNVASK